MQENVSNVDSLKTCCGVLAILSRDEANKLLIARDGIRLITSVMNSHIQNPSLQEAACDLMWSLAFNNNLVKEVIGRQGGIPVIIKGMRLHASCADLLKSACGALSNLCQNAQNQSLIAAHGGIAGILDALKRHKANSNLLPFIFDALASLIVGNERNGREISETGAIKLILESVHEHGSRADLVKSGCHALAILSDSQGQGAKISAANGVKVLLPTLKLHPNHIDLHRVAAVVLLRMLQESPVAREIAERGGVPLMLCVLKERHHEVETVAAACHILYSITHPDAVGGTVDPVNIEAQLLEAPSTAAVANSAVGNNNNNSSTGNGEESKTKDEGKSPSKTGQTTGQASDYGGVNSLNALIAVIRRHSNRKDVVRACVRSLVNLSKFRALLAWIDASESIGAVLAAASEHTQARDITDSCSLLVKLLSKRVPSRPGARLSVINSYSSSSGIGGNTNDLEMSINGLLCCLKARPNDMELVGAVFATITNTLVAAKNMLNGGSARPGNTANKARDWEKDSFRVTLVWASMLARELNPGNNPSGNNKSNVDVNGKNSKQPDLVVSPTTSSNKLAATNNTNNNAHTAAATSKPRQNKLEENKAKKDWVVKNSSKTNQSFWTTDRAVCVFHMARFLKTIVKQYNSSSLSVGVGRLRSKNANSGNPNSGNTLDIVAAKDIVTTLFESMPSSDSSDRLSSDPFDNTALDETLPTAPVSPLASSANPNMSNEAVLSTTWNELDTLLACLIPSIQEAEMNEAAAAAAHNSTVKVANSLAIIPPGVDADNSDSNLKNGAAKGEDAGQAVPTPKADNSASSSSNGGADTHTHDGSSRNNTSSKSGAKKKKMTRSPSSGKLAKKNGSKYSNQPVQFVKGTIKCTCNHGVHPALKSSSRKIPVHPIHDPSLNLRQLHQFSPNELEMIHPVRSNSYGEENEPTDVPTKMQLCYESASAAGLGLQSREPLRFPYEIVHQTKSEFPLFEHSLSFDACFESGNLMKAIQRGPTEYDLFCRPDLHSAAQHTQWFYFAVSNTHNKSLGENQPSRIKFNIVNMLKNDSLFNQGMRPVMYSVKDSNNSNDDPKGWVRCGVPGSISYFANRFTRLSNDGQSTANPANYYTLTFTVDFHNADDTYLLAHSYPYTYTDLKYHLNNLLSSPRTSRHMRRKLLCKTLGGHDADILTIADFAATENKDTGAFGVEEADLIAQSVNKRKCIVLSARVHPGEVGASWMMKGVLDFLTSESEQAALLRSIFVFKIVPMLNPDGVVFGNNRVNLSGVDLNRTWKRPIKTEHPTIYYWKNLIRDLKSTYEVAMFVDLHGHSRKMNTFMYGCDDRRKPRPTVRVFPKLLSWNQYGRKYVSFADCCFAVKKGREGTGRVVVSKELGIHNSYTMEATFCGADFGPLKDVHFNTAHLCESGRALIDTLLDYFLPNPMQREKAANLLKQASEKKAARDRSERMAAARQAMQQIRADNALVAANQLTTQEDEAAGNATSTGTAGKSESITNSININNNGGSSNNNNNNSSSSSSSNNHSNNNNSSSRYSSQTIHNKFSSGKKLATAKVNGFMIARQQQQQQQQQQHQHLLHQQQQKHSDPDMTLSGDNKNNNLASSSTSTAASDEILVRRVSPNHDNSSSKTRIFGNGLNDKHHRITNGFMHSESNSGSTLAPSSAGTSAIHRLRVGSAGGISGSSTPGSSLIRRESANKHLAVLPSSYPKKSLANSESSSPSSQSWLLSTLTRDTEKISSDRVRSLRHKSPSPGPPSAQFGGMLPSGGASGVVSQSASDLHGSATTQSPANKNRNVVSHSHSSGRNRLEQRGVGASTLTVVGTERGGGSSGGNGGYGGIDSLLPRVNSSGGKMN